MLAQFAASQSRRADRRAVTELLASGDHEVLVAPEMEGPMAAATHVTVRLIRFGEVCELPDLDPAPMGDSLRTIIAPDSRAAGRPFASAEGAVWAAVGLFAGEASARASFDAADAAIPWAADAIEVWSGLCQPFSHRGEVDHLGNPEPGSTYVAGDPIGGDESFAVLTTVGWDFNAPDFDINRAMDFGAGVVAVRDSMAGTDGLHSQQSFSVPNLAADAFTFTFWRDDAAMRSFAYRAGVHKEQMDKYKRVHNADRTSFTRLRVLDSSGTWNGTNPLAW